MSKLSLNDISNDIFKHIPNNSIDKNMLNEEVIEAIDSINNYQTSTDNNLNTTDKNIVGAINELLDDANDVRNMLSEEIGGIILNNDTFVTINDKISYINNTLSTFISNNGGSVTGEESLSELLDILYTVTKIKFPIEWIDDCKYIACGDNHTFLLKNDGTVYSCGYNNYGQLGLGDTTTRTSFTQVNISDVKQIVCGSDHTFLLKNDGNVYSCGYNIYGQLGLGDTTTRTSFTQVNISDVSQIACGLYHTFLLKNDGSVYSCGRNYYGQLGLGDTTTTRTSFTQVTTNISDVKEIICGGYHTFLLKNDGSVWCCGYNSYGQLGLGDEDERISFTQVTTNNDVKEIICGYSCTFLLKNDGNVYSCGYNIYGELGLGDTTETRSFTQVNISDVKEIICSGDHTFLIKNDYSVYSCGRNIYGQLGLGSSSINYVTSFTQVTTNISDVKEIICGGYHTFLLKNDGNVYSCGRNNYGQLGLGSTTDVGTFTNTNVNIAE